MIENTPDKLPTIASVLPWRDQEVTFESGETHRAEQKVRR